MSLWTFVKLLAAAAVIGAIGFTAMFVYHMAVKPMGGVFEKIVPHPAVVINAQPDAEFAESVNAAEMPDVDPGEKTFQKAHELIVLGKLAEAREKLNTVVNIFPSSSSAPIARHIVGEMNLDDILSTTQVAGKQTHVIKRGDSFLGIAAHYKTTLDYIVHLNGLQELKNLVPGEELLVMPLEYRLLIEPQRKALSLWDGGRFICEYPIVHLEAAGKLTNLHTTISAKTGQLETHRSKPAIKTHADTATKPEIKAKAKAKTKAKTKAQTKADATADTPAEANAVKAIQLAKLPLQIRANTADEAGARGIFLNPVDIEELFLLTRVGNTVEIRLPAH
ncbi:MAG: LysM peptidoglycan-binding domain-containing protein [Verrucomicrobia bacterium]|nr:MAG: LysM peptidoglycan-binding domain-containing protein [Verrucomicrobiota bacterium]